MPVRNCLFVLILIRAGYLPAQVPVFLKNPSFEDNPQYSVVPGGWRNCAFNNETPPDIHPVKGGIFQVNQVPFQGDTYLGLVTRENGTTESVGQQLEPALAGGQCYSFSVYLARSEKLLSASRVSRELTQYNKPVELRLWGGLSPCGRKSLLAVSPVVDHSEWKKYTFQFRPEEDTPWICLEVYYGEGAVKAYNGNLLLDDASPFIPIHCDTKEALLDPDSIKIPSYTYRKFALPKNVTSRIFFSAYGGGGVYLDLRVVSKPEEIEALIIDNCPQIGFKLASHRLTDEYGIGLKEIAVNVERFKDRVLILGLPVVGQDLMRRRMRSLKRIFREIGLGKHQYRMIEMPRDEVGAGWLCGQQDIWLKIGKRRKS